MWDIIFKIFLAFGAACGIAAYFNAERLRKRLNRTQDVLEEKGVTNRFELIADDKTRNLLLKNRGDRPLSEIVNNLKSRMIDESSDDEKNKN